MKTKPVSVSKNGQSARLFFALQPSHEIQTKLSVVAKELSRKSGGRSVKPENIHLTLLFLGEIHINKIDTICAVVKNIQISTFSMTIQKFQFWKQNHIISAQAEYYPQELFSLVSALRIALNSTGLIYDKRTYKPHITLVRKAENPIIPEQLHKTIEWPVKEWQLLQSKQTSQGIQYIPLERWPLSL